MQQRDPRDTTNLYLAIGLSCLVVLVWSYFFAPPPDKARLAQRPAQTSGAQTPGAQTSGATTANSQIPGQAPNGLAGAAGQGAPGQSAPEAAPKTRVEALAASPRIKLDTKALFGSISLKGGHIDDVSLKAYRETPDPKSPNIVLLSPLGSPAPYYAETGFFAASGEVLALPGPDALWSADRETLTETEPVTLSYDNGQGLVFHRKIEVDPRYMFSVTDSVENKTQKPVTLHPYAIVARHGKPASANFAVLHEGFVGVVGDAGVQEIKYDKIEKEDGAQKTFKGTGGWLGITDKYWAATVIPAQDRPIAASFSERQAEGAAGAPVKIYQSGFVGEAGQTIAPGASGAAKTMVFAGAKEVDALDAYERNLGILKFDLLIDWGWFYFITRPMYWALDHIYKFVGNFGVAILCLTVVIKGLFFPLANRSYMAMAKMKAVAPQIEAIRLRYPDDKPKQSQETMALYKRERINPVAGCLPMLIQLPVFFALYKVLVITIEMRQAPFFGWIKDLSQPDPTNVFNLFGLLPFDPSQIPVFGAYLMLGVWPLIMGVSMFFQMKMNPEPADPTQKMVFAWLPLVFTFTMGSFPAGLVIYWTWNNTLSVIQQSLLMKKAGAKIELWDNLANMFRKKAPG
ncbi:membrane protein insertase YidC [Methylocapsa acidiphila]|uniref:membrane protein insertase YidC n=1 Tax=Methylocapsa acidiphila TaxID=133552 RepID=UPI00040AA44A|nr:membrane protein insertase YidC [Methylocapsa acidiphila]